MLETGNVVRFEGNKRPPGVTPDMLFVVTRVNGRTASVTKLGGNGGRYWRATFNLLTVVDPSTIKVAKPRAKASAAR